MKKGILIAVLAVGISLCGKLMAITVNPASSVTADSANTPMTIPYRDASGNFSAGTITAAEPIVSTTTLNSQSNAVGQKFLIAENNQATSAPITNTYNECVSTQAGVAGGTLQSNAVYISVSTNTSGNLTSGSSPSANLGQACVK